MLPKDAINKMLRVFHRMKWRWEARNLPAFTLLTNNCVGAVVAHDMGRRLDSPIVNMYIPPAEYVEMLRDLPAALASELTFIDTDKPYPVGLLGGKYHLHFMHYKSREEALDAWNRRKGRVNYGNLFVVLVERDGCDMPSLRAFDSLPYINKVALCHTEYLEIKCCFHVPGFENQPELGNIIEYSGFSGRRFSDAFPWIDFLKGRLG